ncbi:MAG TPA: ATP-binding protein [Xanthobacteraceae bacterium]|nr:ATP-binding protein [Xanthobacteraceae bacterium]
MKLSTRMTLAMVSIVLMTASIIGWLNYRNIEQVVLPRALVSMQARAKLLAFELAAAARVARADALGFQASDGVARIVHASLAPAGSAEHESLGDLHARLAGRFAGELRAKPGYAEFRLLGSEGRELLRVDRSGPDGSIRIVPTSELQPKGERDYFQRAMALPPGGVDISPIALQQDYGHIVLPQVPVLHASAPVHSADGRLFGVVVINVDLREVFEHIRQSAGEGTVYLVNEAGDYLIHPDRSREFGFEFAKRYQLRDDFPSLAAALGIGADEPRLARDGDGEEFGVAPVAIRLAEGPMVDLILAWPHQVLFASAIAVRNSSLLATAIAALLAFALAMPLARSLTRPLEKMTLAVTAFGRGEAMAAPTDAHGEIGVLARAFTRMAGEVDAKTAELRRYAETLDRIMSSMADALVVTDEHGKVLLANAAFRAMFGGIENVFTSDWGTQRFHSDEVTPLENEEVLIGRAIRGEKFDAFELAVRREGESAFMHLIASGGPICDARGRQIGAVMVYRNVTEARQIERQLRQSQKLDAIGKLTGGVAHDFNNILTVITGTIDILSDGLTDRPSLAAIAKMIDEAATRGAELTQQLLAFARRQPLEPRAVDPNALVLDAMRLLRPALGEQIEIESMLEHDVWHAVADLSQLNTTLLNLAVNARDAMPNGGKLTLETANVVLDEGYAQTHPDVKPGPYVMIAVSDTGHGIPPALVDKVFEPFFTTKEIGKGTGLGLSMVYGFVKQSGGHIKIYSEVGHGTTIKIYLPRANTISDEPALSAHADDLPGGSETVLVVEDDALVRDYVVAQLKSLGYVTLAAANATEALAQLDAGARFDLLFTDVIMPGGMNGRQLANQVAHRRPGIRVLYTSGYTENAIVHHGRLDAGVALLNKPYRKKDLAEKLRQVLDAPLAPAA